VPVAGIVASKQQTADAVRGFTALFRVLALLRLDALVSIF
jgi:hypothetical protein